jgi:hypothetical protein
VSEKDGVWQEARPMPRLAALNTAGETDVASLSCSSPGNCSAGGTYTAGQSLNPEAFVVTEKHWTWSAAQNVRGLGRWRKGAYSTIGALSCGAAGNCAAAGSDGVGLSAAQAFLVIEKHGVWGSAATFPAR